MVERRSELDRRYHRKKKMRKLKNKLAKSASEVDKQTIVAKIRRLSPDWMPAGEKPAAAAASKPAPGKPAGKK